VGNLYRQLNTRMQIMSAGDERFAEGDGYVVYHLRSILKDATDNPSFFLYSYRMFALPVSVCLGHFSPWVFPKLCCHCKRGIRTYLVVRPSTSSTGKLRKGKHVLHLSSGGNSLLLAIVYPSDLHLTTPSPPNIQSPSFFAISLEVW
jgi:hypothetical protein